MVLGYSLLQIPEFIIFVVTHTKQWFSQIQNRRNQSHTTVRTVKINDKELPSKDILQKETNETYDKKRNDVCADTKYEIIMKF